LVKDAFPLVTRKTRAQFPAAAAFVVGLEIEAAAAHILTRRKPLQQQPINNEVYNG